MKGFPITLHCFVVVLIEDGEDELTYLVNASGEVTLKRCCSRCCRCY